MNNRITRRGFMAGAAKAVVVATTAPSVRVIPRGGSTLVLQFCEGVDMERQQELVLGHDEFRLRATAEEHAGMALTWEGGETEGTLSFAVHPSRPAQYLVTFE